MEAEELEPLARTFGKDLKVKPQVVICERWFTRLELACLSREFQRGDAMIAVCDVQADAANKIKIEVHGVARSVLRLGRDRLVAAVWKRDPRQR